MRFFLPRGYSMSSVMTPADLGDDLGVEIREDAVDVGGAEIDADDEIALVRELQKGRPAPALRHARAHLPDQVLLDESLDDPGHRRGAQSAQLGDIGPGHVFRFPDQAENLDFIELVDEPCASRRIKRFFL
jgi:hypothetical protein